MLSLVSGKLAELEGSGGPDIMSVVLGPAVVYLAAGV